MSVIRCCGGGCCLFFFFFPLLVPPSPFTFSYFVMRHCPSFRQIHFPHWERKQSLSVSQVVWTIKSFFPGFILRACLLFSMSEPQFWTTALFLYSVPMARERSGDQNICKSAEARQSVVERGTGEAGKEIRRTQKVYSVPTTLGCPPTDAGMAYII